jgi:hypothetical protein
MAPAPRARGLAHACSHGKGMLHGCKLTAAHFLPGYVSRACAANRCRPATARPQPATVPGAHLHGRRRALHRGGGSDVGALRGDGNRPVLKVLQGGIRHKSDAAQFVRETILLWEKQTGVCASAQRWVGSTSTLWMGGTLTAGFSQRTLRPHSAMNGQAERLNRASGEESRSDV